MCKLLVRFAARGKIQRSVAAQYRDRLLDMNVEKVAEMNNKRLQERVSNLSENDHFSAQKFWKAKRSIHGSHRQRHSVLDKDGTEMTSAYIPT